MPPPPPDPARGLVPSLRARWRAFLARRERTRADRALARRLQAAFARPAVGRPAPPMHGLGFYVHSGAVGVYGEVRDEAAREAVLALVAGQPGVRRVSDHLQVAG